MTWTTETTFGVLDEWSAHLQHIVAPVLVWIGSSECVVDRTIGSRLLFKHRVDQDKWQTFLQAVIMISHTRTYQLSDSRIYHRSYEWSNYRTHHWPIKRTNQRPHYRSD
jgi:hypothetical protein